MDLLKINVPHGRQAFNVPKRDFLSFHERDTVSAIRRSSASSRDIDVN
jgi:hypothetical protein